MRRCVFSLGGVSFLLAAWLISRWVRWLWRWVSPFLEALEFLGRLGCLGAWTSLCAAVLFFSRQCASFLAVWLISRWVRWLWRWVRHLSRAAWSALCGGVSFLLVVCFFRGGVAHLSVGAAALAVGVAFSRGSRGSREARLFRGVGFALCGGVLLSWRHGSSLGGVSHFSAVWLISWRVRWLWRWVSPF